MDFGDIIFGASSN